MKNLELAAHWVRGRETLPRYLILGMTNLCNSKCVTCFYWDHLNVNRHLEMKLEEYDRALADLGALYSVVLTGGEPTLNRDLPEITKLLYRRHDASNVTMPTNSIIPEQVEAIVARVLESRKDERQTFTVGLSLDHLGERHDFIRGAPGNFVKLEETYRRLAALKRESRGFTLNVQTVLASFNMNDLAEITAWVSANLPEINFHSFELLRPPFPDPSIRALTPAEYAEALRFLRPYWARVRQLQSGAAQPQGRARAPPSSRRSEQERMVYPCYAGTISGVLNPEGTVSLCEVQWEIGNIRDFGYSFKKAWFSEKAVEMRRRIAAPRVLVHPLLLHDLVAAVLRPGSGAPDQVRGAARRSERRFRSSKQDPDGASLGPRVLLCRAPPSRGGVRCGSVSWARGSSSPLRTGTSAESGVGEPIRRELRAATSCTTRPGTWPSRSRRRLRRRSSRRATTGRRRRTRLSRSTSGTSRTSGRSPWTRRRVS